MPVRLNDRVRIWMANHTTTAHPMHLHGHHFAVSCTDGGWVPESAQWLEATTDVPVGAVRAIDFIADAPGDWAFHCHKSHHTMNAMGHNVEPDRRSGAGSGEGGQEGGAERHGDGH
jgi:FtsP/CotA-like multicopper oxidase with cupredoxin domain